MQKTIKHILTHILMTFVLVAIAFGTYTSVKADDGDPYPLDESLIFIAQGLNPTKLYTLELQGNEMVFIEQKSQSKISYNAMGFNQNDGYLYAIKRENNGNVSNVLLKIGQGGKVVSQTTVTGLPSNGNGYNQGTFGTGKFAETLFVRRGNASNSRIFLIDIKTASAKSLDLSREIPNVADLVFLDGNIWAFHTNNKAYRINPDNGTVDVFDHNINGLNLGVNGAQWVMGNGNVGVSQNSTGNIYQFSVTNSTSGTPSFTLINTIKGPANAENDGAAIYGLPTDLEIIKNGPSEYQVGQEITYTLIVKNNGDHQSSGSVVKDQLPAQLTNITTTSSGCSVDTNTLTCNVGVLNVDESVTISYKATVGPGTTALTNTATVLGNEEDSNLSNNSSTSTAQPKNPELQLVKNYEITDNNSNRLNDSGDTVVWTFEVKNTGKVSLEDVIINDAYLESLGLSISCSKTVLDIGESTLCKSESYTLTDTDVINGEIVNIATASGKTEYGEPVESKPDQAIIPIGTPPLDLNPHLTLVKSYIIIDTNNNEINDTGDFIKWIFTVTNSGDDYLTDITINDPLLDSMGLSISCSVTSLDVGEKATCESESHEITDYDVMLGQIINSATASGVASDEQGVESDPDTAIVPVEEAPTISLVGHLTLVKSYRIIDVNKNNLNDPGDKIIWVFTVTNTGDLNLSNLFIKDDLLAKLGINVICKQTTLLIGESTICESEPYEISSDDSVTGLIVNVATASSITTDDEIIESDTSRARVEVVKTPIKPEEPVKPVEPVKPEEPAKPEEPVKPIETAKPPMVLPSTGVPIETFGYSGPIALLVGLLCIVGSYLKKKSEDQE